MITYYDSVEQGSPEWASLRCGRLTASEMSLLVTPTLKVASNDKERGHLYELAAQRVTKYVEPKYVSDDMLRGIYDEVKAKEIYSEKFSHLQDTGFVINDKFGFVIGCSPDALVGEDGIVECKSRRMKYQIQTIASNEIPKEYSIQLQTSLLVTERKWLDFISYSAGLPLFVKRVFPDKEVQEAIVAAATVFEANLSELLASYNAVAAALIPTEREVDQGDEIIL